MTGVNHDSHEAVPSGTPTPVHGTCKECEGGVMLLRYGDGGAIVVDPTPRMTIADDQGRAHSGYRLHRETCPRQRGLLPTFRPPSQDPPVQA